MGTEAVGIVGVGIIGSAMVKHLLASGRTVFFHDISPENIKIAEDMGGTAVQSAAGLPAKCPTILLSLPNVAALDATVAALAGESGEGCIVVETSTLPVQVKSTASVALQAAGYRMMDAPVSGTGAQAAAKDLAIFASGTPEDFETVLPVLQAISRSVQYLGAFGAGMKMKLLANHLVAIHTLAAAEVLAFGADLGMDRQQIVDVLNDSAGASRMLAVRGPVMAEDAYDPPTAHLEILVKDLALIQQLADDGAVQLPLLDRAAEIYRAAGAEGWGRKDLSSIHTFLRERNRTNGAVSS